MQDRVAEFRGVYRAQQIPPGYRGYAHLGGTLAFATLGVTSCILALDDVQPREWLTLPATFFYANLVEYAGHRGPMHHPVRGLKAVFERHARQHHRFFTDECMQLESSADLRAVLFPLVLVVFYFGLFALPLTALLGWAISRNVALLFLATALAYYLNYELLHLAYHANPAGWAARIPGMRLLRRLHTRHHDPVLMQVCNFNITYPMGDLIFRTLFAGRPREDRRR
jgi:Fatty acid hydroxylase